MDFNFQTSIHFRKPISLNYTSKEQSFQKFALFRVSKVGISFSFHLTYFNSQPILDILLFI